MDKGQEKTIGSFVVERELGEGGMGVVLLARQKGLDRPVVLKKLRREMASNPELVERFHREARAAARIHHQNVVTVYDCFSWRSDTYIAQEFVDGVDLRTALSRSGSVPYPVAALVVLEVLRGLEEIHARGTVHRDLKPANILLGRGGEVKIADFGIVLEPTDSSLTQPGVMLGSPPYMPPEQLLGDRLDFRADLFSLGALFYEMLAGVPPFRETEGDQQESLLRRIQRGRYPRLRKQALDVPRYAARAIATCLRPRPQQRIRSAADLRMRLERRLRHPTPASCRTEIAGWLAARKILPTDGGQTVPLPAALPARSRLRVRRWAAVALVLALLGWGVMSVKLDPAVLERAKGLFAEPPAPERTTPDPYGTKSPSRRK
jgi:serine/threonine-protein kinase